MVFGIVAIGLNFIFSALNYFAGSPNKMASQISSRSSSISTRSDCTSLTSKKSSQPDAEQKAFLKRLNTFDRMPTPHNVGPNVLAKGGFFYSKTIKGTRCTRCKKTVLKWKPGDKPDERRFHKRGCKFIRTDEPLDTSTGSPERNEPEQMEDSPSEIPEAIAQVRDTREAASLPVKVFPEKNTQFKSMPIDLTQKIDSSSSTAGTDDFPIPRLTPVEMIRDDEASLPSFTQTLNRNRHTIESEPINRNSSRGRNRATTSRRNQSSSGSRVAALPEDIADLDMTVSTNRLETFRRYWSSRNAFKNIHLLVICGFICLGQGDAVQCFCCQVILANWSRNDDPRRRHIECSPQCRFARGADSCGNVPLPAGRRDHSPSSIRSTGSRGRHSHMPHTRSSPRHDTRAAAVPTEPSLPEAYANMTPSQRERNNLMLEFPCQNPANEAMRDERERLRSFQNSSFRRLTRLRKSNESLAQAGMYYDGVRDCTRCWYCGGGLEKYLPNDDPWVEHAKFYPECEYLLQQRGPAWITSISIQYPNLVRPLHPQQASNAPPSSGTTPVVEGSNTPGSSVLDESMTTQPVIAARQAGFLDPQIRQAQQRRILSLGSCYQTADALIEALLHPEADPSTIEPATSQPVTPVYQPISAQPFQPGPRPQRQNIVISGGNFVGPNAVEAAAASAEQNANTHQPASGQPRRRNIVITGGTFLGPSYINGQLYPNPQAQPSPYSTSHTSNTFTVNGQSLQEYLANQDEPMEVQTANGTMQVFNNVGANVTTSGSGLTNNPASTRTSALRNTPSATTTSTSSSSRPVASAEERLEALERERLCKICLNSPAQVLFNPCGHICSCVDCARRVTDCPVCRRRIVRYQRIYTA